MIIPLRELFKRESMEQVMIRIPASVRVEAKQLVKESKSAGLNINESDVYRNAILFFMQKTSTNSRNLNLDSGNGE